MKFACLATDDFFRSRIDHMIDLRHPLAVLASRIPWQQIEGSVAHLFSRKARSGIAMPDLDLFGEQVQRSERLSHAGRPRVPLRIMISLLYLKHAFNESDEGVVERWRDTPRWQYFSGCAYYEDRLPCDATTLVKFRQLLGEEGVEELLAQTINVALELKLIEPQELSRVIVDSTVQEKAIAHPTDSRLLEVGCAMAFSCRLLAHPRRRFSLRHHPLLGLLLRFSHSGYFVQRTPYPFHSEAICTPGEIGGVFSVILGVNSRRRGDSNRLSGGMAASGKVRTCTRVIEGSKSIPALRSALRTSSVQ